MVEPANKALELVGEGGGSLGRTEGEENPMVDASSWRVRDHEPSLLLVHRALSYW